MVKNKIDLIWSFVVFFVLISFIIFAIFYGPENIIDSIGVGNSYIVLFLFAVFGGVSFATSFSFFTSFATFYIGGLNFFVLVLIGAVGLSIGDSVFYYLSFKGSDFIENSSYANKIKLLSDFVNNKVNPKYMFLFVLVYAAFIPLPKDILCIVLGISKYSYFKFISAFFIGNILFNFIFLFFVSIGFRF